LFAPDGRDAAEDGGLSAMYKFFRYLLFRLDPETSHQLTLQLLRIAGNIPFSNWLLTQLYKTESKPVQAFGLTFKNPIGLAAGYDKDALAIRGLSALGFGHIEIGTVTPEPQAGNQRPRVFRLLEDEAVINRMGFPSRGAEYVATSLRRSNLPFNRGLLRRRGLDPSEKTARSARPTAPRNDMILGINLGKNKDTPLEEAARDYIALIKVFSPLADYLTINISSPNTVGLRRLQGRGMLEGLLEAVARERRNLSLTPNPSPHFDSPALPGTCARGKCAPGASVAAAPLSASGRGGLIPILVKISPDLDDEELDDAIGIILDKKMDGIIATNTTLAREGLGSRLRGEAGGLSGSPLAAGSEAVLRQVVKRVDGRVPIVSVGGIMNLDDAKKRFALGASLVQVYTGLVYRGPALVKQILKSL